MTSLFRKTSEGAVTATANQDLRRKQIASLSSHALDFKEIEKEFQYDIACYLPTGNTIYLNLRLPIGFPDVPPILTVKPAVSHPWIHPQTLQIIGLPKLTAESWTQHSILGKLIKEVIEEFRRRPPQKPQPPLPLLSSQYSTLVNNLNRPIDGNSSNPLPYIGISRKGNELKKPDRSDSTFTVDIDRYSADELNDLLMEDDKFIPWFEDMEEVKSRRLVLQELRKGNQNLAQKTLAREEELENVRKLIMELQNTFKDQKDLFDRQLKLQQDKLIKYNPDYIMSKLRAALMESEELSDHTAENFLNGKIACEDFLKQYREVRKVAHIRGARIEQAGQNPSIFQ